MNFIEGNLLSVKRGILCQQVNCRGVMGAGLAKQIRAKWPNVFDSYQLDHALGNLNLGFVNWAYVGDEVVIQGGKAMLATTGWPLTRLVVANLCGQYLYKPRGINHTNYDSLAKCLREVEASRIALEATTGEKYPIFIPHGIGCGLAGGDWTTVLDIIKRMIPAATIMIR